MRNNTRHKRLWVWFRQRLGARRATPKLRRGPVDHVILLDGTNSTLRAGEETNIGLIYRLLADKGAASIYYEAGLQWENWQSTLDVATGRGINRQIIRAYGYLASRYRPGDRIFLMGFSRGAFAVRSLAGVIDQIGLLKAENATERDLQQVYRLYRYGPDSASARHYGREKCHPDVSIEMLGVFDTVKALGLRLPILWRFTEPTHAFHGLELGRIVRNGYQALAQDETRAAFEPVLWETETHGHVATDVRVEQMWFKGRHGDIGGQLWEPSAPRGLSNIPLVWMLGKAETCGLHLPIGWRMQFPCDPTTPSIGRWCGWSKLFLLRRRRKIGRDRSETQFGGTLELPILPPGRPAE